MIRKQDHQMIERISRGGILDFTLGIGTTSLICTVRAEIEEPVSPTLWRLALRVAMNAGH
jgi:hypothetical protein